MTSDLRILEPSEFDGWDAFVSTCPQGTIFHTAWWYRAWQMAPVVRALYDKDGQIQAGICYATGRRLGTTGIVRPPWTPRIGPIFRPLTEGGRCTRYTHAKRMLLSVIGSLPKLGLYDFQLGTYSGDLMPFIWNGFDTLVGYTYVLPHAERDGWMQHASKTQQRRLRNIAQRASEENYTLDAAPPFDEVLYLLRETAEFKQFSLSSYLHRMPAWWEAVRERCLGRAYVLRDGQGRAASAALMAHDTRYAYYLAGGIRRDLRPGFTFNVMLFQQMIHDAHQLGLDFDFEGSVLPGVERFFRELGGELRPTHRVIKIPALAPSLIWHAYRYWTRHRNRPWVWHD
jgi:hypothetical protein